MAPYTHYPLVWSTSWAILRGSPKSGGERRGVIPHGGYVMLVAELGDWYEVRGNLYGDGYIHRDLSVKY